MLRRRDAATVPNRYRSRGRVASEHDSHDRAAPDSRISQLSQQEAQLTAAGLKVSCNRAGIEVRLLTRAGRTSHSICFCKVPPPMVTLTPCCLNWTRFSRPRTVPSVFFLPRAQLTREPTDT